MISDKAMLNNLVNDALTSIVNELDFEGHICLFCLSKQTNNLNDGSKK